MKKLILTALLLAPSLTFAATPNVTVRATLVQQLLTQFVAEVNGLQQMQDTIATAVDPTQFSDLKTLLQSQFNDTQAQLDNLLNDTPVQQSQTTLNQEPAAGATPSEPSQPVTVVAPAQPDSFAHEFTGRYPEPFTVPLLAQWKKNIEVDLNTLNGNCTGSNLLVCQNSANDLVTQSKYAINGWLTIVDASAYATTTTAILNKFQTLQNSYSQGMGSTSQGMQANIQPIVDDLQQVVSIFTTGRWE